MSVRQCLIGLFCVSGVTGCDFRYEENTCAAITKAICDCQLVTYWICILAHILCDTSVALLNLRASLVLESGGDIWAQVKKLFQHLQFNGDIIGGRWKFIKEAALRLYM